jgi:hypothetical protein
VFPEFPFEPACIRRTLGTNSPLDASFSSSTICGRRDPYSEINTANLESFESTFIKQNIQGFLVNSRFRKFNFSLLLFSRVNNACAADFGDFSSVAVETPDANVFSDNIADKSDSVVKIKRQFVEKLDISEHVII